MSVAQECSIIPKPVVVDGRHEAVYQSHHGLTIQTSIDLVLRDAA